MSNREINMKLNWVQVSENDIKEMSSSDNKKYMHLDDCELEYLMKSNVLVESILKEYISFREKISDLKKFERKLESEEITDEFIKKYNLSIIILAYFNRMYIPKKRIFSLIINCKDLINIDEELKYIRSRFNYILVEVFGYSKGWVRQIFCEVIRLRLFYHKPVKLCSENIEEYLLLAPNYIYKCSIKTMFRFLSEIEYIEVEDSLFLREEKVTLQSKNCSIEFNNITNEYLLQVKNTKARKTLRATRSNLKNFFDFMQEKLSNINEFSEIKNRHIKMYVKYLQEKKTYRGQNISPSTINARLEELQKLFRYVEEHFEGVDSLNIISRYDKVKEYNNFPKLISKKDMLRLIRAIGEIDEERYLQEKLILILMLDTGRRFHEVRVLSYSCLQGDNHIFFHKTKTGGAINQKVGPTCINAVLNAQKLCNHINKEIFSKVDNKKVRRLFPSIKDKCRTIVGEKAVADVFRDIQVKSGIVDHNNKPLFTLHDNKRNFISNMESAGISAPQIAKLINQNIKTIAQYEVRNDKATQILKEIEEKKVLVGKYEEHANKIERENIFNVLSQNDIIERNKINLIEKIQNPKEVIPLPFGECTQIENIVLCGQLFCIACENYKLFTDNDKEQFERFCFKFYIHIYMYKKNEKLKEIYNKFEQICKNVLINNNMIDTSNYKKYVNSIKKRARNEVEVIKSGKLRCNVGTEKDKSK